MLVTNALDSTKPKASGKQRFLSLLCKQAGLSARLSREEILHCFYHKALGRREKRLNALEPGKGCFISGGHRGGLGRRDGDPGSWGILQA